MFTYLLTYLHGVGFASVCLLFCTISKKTAPNRITKLDEEMFHHESWKPIYFGSKRQRSRSQGTKKQCQCGLLHSCEYWLFVVFITFRLFMVTTLRLSNFKVHYGKLAIQVENSVYDYIVD